jgi:hypothetical protein
MAGPEGIEIKCTQADHRKENGLEIFRKGNK